MFPIVLDAFHGANVEAPETGPQEGDAAFSDALYSAIDQSGAAPVNSDKPLRLDGLERLLKFLAQESEGRISDLESRQIDSADQADSTDRSDFTDHADSTDQANFGEGRHTADSGGAPAYSGSPLRLNGLEHLLSSLARENEGEISEIESRQTEPAEQVGSAVREAPDVSSAPRPIDSDAEASIRLSDVSDLSTDASDRPVNLAAPSSAAASRSIEPLSGAVDMVDRSIEKLHPALQRRVERVIERMRSEYGHEVELVEGRRTAARQDYLYAQGRTRTGPVVTWTRHSRHTQGQAADLMVDGGWNDPSAYERLNRIAQSEGLRTLGTTDPGHVELAPEWTARSGGIASVARVATVATVARPSAARPSVPLKASNPNATVFETRAVGSQDLDAGGPEGSVTGDSRSTSDGHDYPDGASSPSRDQERSTPPLRTASASAAATRVESFESPGFSTEVSATFARGEPTPVSPVTGRPSVDTMSQVERVLEAQEAQRTLTPQRVAVRLTGLERPVNSIRVGLLDGTVDVDVALTDRVGSRQLRSNVVDLFRALDGHGLELGSLGVDAGLGRADVMGEAWMGLRSLQTSDVLKALLGGDNTEWLQDGGTRERSTARDQKQPDDANAERSHDQMNQEEASR